MGEVGALFLHGRFNIVIAFRWVCAASSGAEKDEPFVTLLFRWNTQDLRGRPLLEFVNCRVF